MMDSGGNGAILTKALKDLMMHWGLTETVWRDQARADFERDILQGLAPAVRDASRAIDEIEELLREVRKECDDR